MSRRVEAWSTPPAGAVRRWAWLPALALGALPPAAAAQEAEPEPALADAALEEYLAERDLRELLATHLEQQLRAADGQERMRLADRLGKVYVSLLDQARSPEARRVWEERSGELLRMVPESDSFDLRISLAKVNYLHAEDIVERHRIRMANPAEVAEAERILRASSQLFQDIGGKVHRRVEALERREQSGREENIQTLREMLAEARRLRSLAMYYAGWSNCYLSYLLEDPRAAGEALTHWGWLLNAGDGRQASVDRLAAGLLRYEHIARASLGSAIAESQRGNDDTALRWLDAVESAEDVPDAVRQQIFSRRMIVLASAKRWADLEMIVRRRREPKPGGPATPLPLPEARLLAVLMLETIQQDRAASFARDAVQALAGTALGDLVSLGEVGHVIDLVGRYGTTPLAGQGFIVQYVRGLETYESAREAHTSSGDDPEAPTSRDAIANSYRQAANSLRAAVESGDAGRFPSEHTNAGLLLGLALYYAGDLVQAADQFEATSQSAARPEQAEEALWLAVVALDKAIEGGKRSVEPRLQRLATMYLSAHPRSERAAKLLLRKSSADLVDPDQAVEVLLAVGRDSPLYEAARRHAAGLLYQLYRRSTGSDRDFAAVRFVTVAEEVLGFDRRQAGAASDAQSTEAVRQVTIRVRQILDAVLGMSTPDLARAKKAIEALDAVHAYAGVELTEDAEAELTYRRLQIALATGDSRQADELLARLHSIGGRFAEAADRLLYREALDAWNANRGDADAAARVVRHGAQVMRQFGADAASLANATVYSLHNTTADAAAAVWRIRGDVDMRDVAIRIDRALIEASRQTVPVLRRHAELSEAAGNAQAALDAWRTLLSGVPEASPEWYEARYHSLRMLAGLDPARAREAMSQHKLLHPDFGPEPWGKLIAQLDRQIPASAPSLNGDQPKEGP